MHITLIHYYLLNAIASETSINIVYTPPPTHIMYILWTLQYIKTQPWLHLAIHWLLVGIVKETVKFTSFSFTT